MKYSSDEKESEMLKEWISTANWLEFIHAQQNLVKKADTAMSFDCNLYNSSISPSFKYKLMLELSKTDLFL